mgnify:CR=1 FL=1
MFHVNKFIAEAVTQRNASMFREDLTANQELLTREIAGKKVLVIDKRPSAPCCRSVLQNLWSWTSAKTA